MNNPGLIRTTLKGGLVFLLPIGFLALVLAKAFEVVLKVSRPIAEQLPVEGFAGVLLVNLLAVFILVLVCLFAGLLANLPWIRSKVSRLEDLLLANIPVYSFADGMMRSVAAAESQAANLVPVLAHFDDNTQLGFEVERTARGAVVVYLPGSPNPWSGTTIFMPQDRVEPLDIKTHEAIKLIRVLGRGTDQTLGSRFDLYGRYDDPGVRSLEQS